MNYNARSLSRLGPSGAYGKAIMELGEKYENFGVFTADLRHFSGLDRFAASYPEKMFNVGIAEQNLIGVAAGYASEGNISFASTYASFAAMRCLDQIFLNMSYMKFNVKLVGLAAGFSTGILGPTHSCINDIAIFRSMPNIVILSPADGMEAVNAIRAAASYEGPVYVRLTGGMNNPIVYDADYDYEIGKNIRLREGKDVAIFATGTMVYESLKAAEVLQQNDISVTIYDVHTIRPFDLNSIKVVSDSKMIVTVEEHAVYGGLGDMILNVINEERMKKNVLKIGVPCEYSCAASYNALKNKYKLNSEKIAEKILNEYKLLAKGE